MNPHISHQLPSGLLTIASAWLTPNSNVLDLACGSGRNGLALSANGHQVTFLDKDSDALACVNDQHPHLQTIQADLETQPTYQLPNDHYDVLMVFRYLHRPLFPMLINALKPGGLIIYETFNWQQASIGRPKNPNFLLQDDELLQHFELFDKKHYFQGYCQQQQAHISQYIGIKPN